MQLSVIGWAAMASVALIAVLLLYGVRQWRRSKQAAEDRRRAQEAVLEQTRLLAAAQAAAAASARRQDMLQAALQAEATKAMEAAQEQAAANLAASDARQEAARTAERVSEAEAAAAAAAAAAEQERAALQRAEAQRLGSQRAEALQAEALQAESLRAAELAQAERAHAAAVQAQSQARLSEAARSSLLPPRRPQDTLVMVADDSKVVRVKTSRLLAQHHYRVVVAEDGDAAARLIEDEVPLVLITDVEMPGMDGFALTRHVRQHPRAAHIPIIMITSADDRLQSAASAAGVTLVLGKPYAEEALIACIERAQTMSVRESSMTA